MLEVVHHQQYFFLAKVIEQLLLRVAFGEWKFEHIANGGNQPVRFDRRQRNHPRAVDEHVSAGAGGFLGKAGLADAAQACQCDESASGVSQPLT